MPKFAKFSLIALVLTVVLSNSVQAQLPFSLVINELMASNSSVNRDPQGQYDDWIELYNYGNDTIDIGGMYLTDDLANPTKWQIPPATTIPAGGYLLIWADNDVTDASLHTNFKLDGGGEEIGLFDSDGSTLIDSVVFGAQTTDVSYGRYPDASDDWRFFAEPGPAGKNVIVYEGFVDDVQFSHDRGFYDAPFSITLATETEGATIFYTLDGSEPYDLSGRAPSGTVYTTPVFIERTTYIRAVATRPGWKPSNIDTYTYIFLDDVIEQPRRPDGFPVSNWGHAGPDYEMDPVVIGAYSDTIKDDLKSIPTVSLVMNRDSWFGSRGIYVNESQDGTERVVSMEFIDPGTGGEFQINCAISMQGGVSGGGTSLNRWKSDKLSMRPRFKTTTDDGTPTGGPAKLNYKVFVDSPTETFDTLVLDARLGNAWNYGGGVTDTGTRPWISGRPIYQPDVAQYTRDQFTSDIQNALGGYGHHGRHIHLYINGLYWGLYNLHERPDHRFAAAYFGGDADDYDCLKHNRNLIINGSNAGYNELLSITESGMESNERYQLIQQYLDVPNFINYLLPNYFVGNYDWGHKNWYATHNGSDPNGLWRFHHWDGEHLMESLYDNVTGRDNSGGPTRIHHRLMQNAEYRLLFADHVHKHFFNDGALTPEGATALYQIRLDDVDRAVVGESARWGDNQIGRFARIRYMRDPHWLLERDWLLGTYFSNRSGIVLDQFRARGWYPDVDAPVFNVNGSYQHGGEISPTDMFSMTATTGTIYYTLDGSDPRMPQTSPEDRSGTVILAENAAKRVIVPAGPVNDDWKSDIVFNDSAWLSSTDSPGGVGYERSSGYEDFISLDIEDRMYGTNTSCYIRIPFTFIGDLDEFNYMTLDIRYDDGFVAYLNGVEVARRNFTGEPAWNSNADASHNDAEAVSFESINISTFLDQLQEGDNLLAVHGLNTSTASSDLLISVEVVAGERTTIDNTDIFSLGTIEYTEPFALDTSAHVKARVLSNGTWSALNEAAFSIGSVVDNLRITEIMYNPYSPDDVGEPNEEYIELKNIGAETINLNLVKLTNGVDFTFPRFELAPNEYVVVVQDIDAFEAKYGQNINIAGQYTGRLNNAGERIRLEDAIGQTILDFSYADGWRSVADGDGFSLTAIDPVGTAPEDWNDKDSWRASSYIGGSPGADDSGIIPNPETVVINELLANSPGNSPDWIELHNTTDTAIDIGGWYLSDSGSNLTKYEIAAGTSVPANGYVVFYEDRHFGNPGLTASFALSADGERIYLSSSQNGALTGYRQVEDFGASETSVSFGRYYKPSTGNYNFVAMSENTPGSANSEPQVGPIVINEIMYNPSWPDGGSYTNDQYEYVELYNIGSEPVSLGGWKFTDGIDFTFPEGVLVTIPAGGYLLVVKHPDAFMWRYPSIPADSILGPYDGNLSNAGERLELSMDGDIRIDRVSFSDGSHPEDCPGGVDLWPVEADGIGQSLTRRVPSDYGNDPDNWNASAPSPGQ